MGLAWSSRESDSTVRWLEREDGRPDWEKERSVASSAVSTADLVRAVDSSPSARPLAKDLRAGGPGGLSGAGAMPGTSVPWGRARFGVAARESGPTPGREEGRGERARGEGGEVPSLVQSLSLVSREGGSLGHARKMWGSPWTGVRTATMSVCNMAALEEDEVKGDVSLATVSDVT